MTITTPPLTSFTAGELSPRLEGRMDLTHYFNGCRTLENFLVHPHGGAWRRSGLRFMAKALGDGPGLFIPFEFNREHTYLLELDRVGQKTVMRVFSGDSPVLINGTEFRMDLPYLSDELHELRHAQSGDFLVLVHPRHPPRKLLCAGAADWTLTDIAFIDQPEKWKENNYPSCVTFHQERLVLAATPDRPATIWMSRVGDFTDMRLKSREAPLEDWRDFTCSGTGTGKSGEYFTVKNGGLFEKGYGLRGKTADGSLRYYQYRGEEVFDPDGADDTVKFGSHIEVIHDASGNLNESFWTSCEVGDRVEAPPGEKPLDDDAVELTLSGRQANGIRFLVSKARLWVGCAGGEWTVCGSGAGDPVTPAGAQAGHEGTCGAEPHQPENVGFASIFIQRGGRKVREMAYRFESDAYVSTDLTLLSGHITGPGVIMLACLQEPDPIIFCLRKDGNIAALTYQRDQKVTAWSRIITDGFVEHICAIHSPASGRDELWCIVRRETGGIEHRYIERLDPEFEGDPVDAFFVDCGVTLTGDAQRTFAGLEHLAGRTVSVLADGAVHSDVPVSAQGTISLNTEASTIQAGLPFVSTLRPMRMEAGSYRGTAQTKRKRVVSVSVRFHRTLGGKVGPSPDRLETIHFRTPATPMGNAPEPWSGDKSVLFSGGWDRDGSITVVQDQPLPMCLLLIVPKAVINE
ncbi:hypothetical protein [Desulfovibrio oxyclinae]|uniref:hypothetical protein n=1 Tax=Desulfovibrio oxyclinae TaxID=63560 RepID=UPI0003785540|nr:hypothetical protein [Desulfovibrio oxyclinae]